MWFWLFARVWWNRRWTQHNVHTHYTTLHTSHISRVSTRQRPIAHTPHVRTCVHCVVCKWCYTRAAIHNAVASTHIFPMFPINSFVAEEKSASSFSSVQLHRALYRFSLGCWLVEFCSSIVVRFSPVVFQFNNLYRIVGVLFGFFSVLFFVSFDLVLYMYSWLSSIWQPLRRAPCAQ